MSTLSPHPNAPPEMSPEEYRDAVARERRLMTVLKTSTPLSKILIGVNVAIFAVAFFWGDTLGIVTPYFNNAQLVLFSGMKVNELLAAGEWWRLVSSQFVHLDFMHIAFNAYGLYVLGPMVERFYGWKRFLTLYIASGTVGALASYWFVAAPSGGASGAIYGLVGVLIVFGIKYRQELPKRVSKALTRGMIPWVAFGIGIGFLDSIPMDNGAHLGGLISGGLFVFITRSKLRPETGNSRLGDKLAWAGAILALAALLWTGAHWGQEVGRCVTGDRAQYFECYPELEPALFPRGG